MGKRNAQNIVTIRRKAIYPGLLSDAFRSVVARNDFARMLSTVTW